MPLDTVRVPDDILCCSACGFQTMAKARDSGWKGAEFVGGEALFWYCPKAPCQDAYETSLAEWQRSLGYTPPDTVEDV